MLQTQYTISDKWYAIGISPRIDVGGGAERVQGIHGDYVLVIVDEASGIRPKLWQGLKGLRVGDQDRFLAIGNPGSPSGEFYNAFRDPMFAKLTIKPEDTPNIKAGKTVIPGLITQEWINDRKQDWGIDSPMYISKIMAEFPAESDDTLVPLTWIERAEASTLPIVHGPIGIGVDVARKGGCWSVVTVMDGDKLIDIQAWQGIRTDELESRVAAIAKVYYHPQVVVDDTGVGGGVSDHLANTYDLNVTEFVSTSASSDKTIYCNLRAEMFWQVRRDFQNGIIDLNNVAIDYRFRDLLKSQLSSIKKLYKNGKIQIESKDDMEHRNMPSPDFADSFMMARASRPGAELDQSMKDDVDVNDELPEVAANEILI